jgi:hypothetical protein
MALINPQVKEETTRVNYKIPLEVATAISELAEFLQSDLDYVVAEAFRAAIKSDRKFQEWRSGRSTPVPTTNGGAPRRSVK